MNNNHSLSRSRSQRGSVARHLMMAAAIAIGGVAASAAVQAQATSGDIFGHAPAGETILVQSTTMGLQREGKVDAKGRYDISHLPFGNYTVTLKQNGQPIARHLNVGVLAGRGSRIDFNCVAGKCADVASK